MERHKTRIWRGGMAEILKHKSELAAATPRQVVDLRLDPAAEEVCAPRMVVLVPEGPPAPQPTRVMNLEELKLLREAQHALAPLRDPRALSVREPTDPELQRLTGQLRAAPRTGKRAWLVLVVALLAVGGWYARRASATGHAQAKRAARAQTQAPEVQAGSPIHTATPPALEEQTVPVVLPLVRAPAAPRVLPRAGVDALAAGDDLAAARLYRTLASQAPDGSLYQAAAEILTARARSRERAGSKASR